METRTTQSEFSPRKPYPFNVLLINPSNPASAVGMNDLVKAPPLGLEYVGESIREMVQDVKIHDGAVDYDWLNTARKSPPRIVGITCNYTMVEKQVINLARQVKEDIGKDVLVVVGGQHAQMRPINLMRDPAIDMIAVGRGETIMPNIVRAVGENQKFDRIPNIIYKDEEGKVTRTKKTQLKLTDSSSNIVYPSNEMDERPLITGDLVRVYKDAYYHLNHRNLQTLETSRGCTNSCVFCSGWIINGKKWFVASPEQTVKQILALTKDNKPAYIAFTDDLVSFAIPEIGLKIAHGLKEAGKNRNNLRIWAQIRADSIWPKDPVKRQKAHAALKALAAVGLDMALIGIESFRQEELDRVGKGIDLSQILNAIEFLHSIGVQIWGAQLVFSDWLKPQFNERIADNQRYKIDAPQFTMETPLPGTVLFNRLKQMGVVLPTDPEVYDFYHIIMQPTLSEDEFRYNFARLYQETGPRGSREILKRLIEHFREDKGIGISTDNDIRRLTQAIKTMGDPDYYLKANAGSTPVLTHTGNVFTS